MVNKIKWVIFSVIASMLIVYSICYAEIGQVSIDDIKDHEKITTKLNQIIDKINDERLMDKKAIESVQKQVTYSFGVAEKMIDKMKKKDWVATHAEVTP